MWLESRRSVGICCAAILILTLWGAWLRIAHLGRQSLWIDEAVIVTQARGILAHGVPRMENGQTEWNSAVATYLTAGGLLAGDMHVGARLPAALAGTFTVPLMFLLVGLVTRSCLAGLLGAAIIAFSKDQIAWSRQAEPYIYLQFFLLLATWCLFEWVNRRRPPWIIAGSAATVLCIGTHAGGYVAALSGACILLADGMRHFIAIVWPPCPAQMPERPGTKWSPHWGSRGWLAVGLVATAGLAFCLWHLPVGHSNVRTVYALLQNPYKTQYETAYGRVLLQSFGLVGALFGIVGIIAGAVTRPRIVLPLAVAGAVYFFLISRRMWMFGERYAFPLYGLMVIFVVVGMVFLAHVTSKAFPIKWRHIALNVTALSCLLFICVSTPAAVVPQSSYWLGFTAPQPNWRSAFRLIQNHFMVAGKPPGAALNVVSPYPVLHDLYLGPTNGVKFYLPISFGGHPNGVSWSPAHTTANTVHSLVELQSIRGYLMMDDMALRMVGDERIASYLRRTPPDVAVADQFNVLIWRLGGH